MTKLQFFRVSENGRVAVVVQAASAEEALAKWARIKAARKK